MLLSYSIFFLILFSSSFSLTQDGLFLLQFKHLLDDPDNSLATWHPSSLTPCHWQGITCHPHTSAVISINLTNANLTGPLPATTLCRITTLTTLLLSWNNFNTTIPTTLSNCHNLQHLDLSENLFVGPIPHTLSQIPSLQHLDLSFNNLTGPIPSSLGNLTKLESLKLVSNFLNGTIPSSLANIKTLKLLHLADNQFGSPIPSRLGELESLEELFLARCLLVGPIPSSLGNLSRARLIDLSTNMLVGPIPESFTRLQSVTQMELYENSLSGELPRGMGNMTRLETFDASVNNLTGTIPDELCELQLASLNLFANNLVGSLPSAIARSKNLYELKLFDNNLVGTLPSDLGSVSPLHLIDVSFNNFSGEIPASICRQGKLKELLMLNNSLSGKIPESLGNCTSLRRVRLKNNKLSGSVPDGFWALPRLYFLELLDNSLSGKISSAISRAQNLSSLLLSNNNFDGPIPHEIGMVKSLMEFHGSHNKFSGGIPDGMYKLDQLSSVDLSYNELSGEISGWVRNWTKLDELNLSNNKFDGKIPNELGSLPVLNYLDLSFNFFSGEIPLELQHLKLNVLNLSYNKLSGRIPPLYAKDSYKMSFIGNPGLCGHLPVFCLSSGVSTKKGYSWIFKSMFVLAGILFILGVTWFYLKYRKFNKLKKGMNIVKWKSFHKLCFSEFEIENSLSEDNVIGSGGSGKVYKVELSNGEVVAVKKLWGTTRNENAVGVVPSEKDEFDVEVETLGKIRHKNIVRLWCCCNSGDSKLLVYEYMQNGSLADMLRSSKKNLLDWPTRCKIAIDAAEGLSYLHHDCNPPIVHRDVKSSNILLDGEFAAKIADFGVAKIIRSLNQSAAESMSVIAGSYGYIAPEYAYTLRVNEKCDIYSFGVVILELVTGRPPIDAEYGENDLVKWVSSTLEHEGLDHVIDPTLDSKYKEVISKVLNLGILCTSSLPMSRPTMRRVVKMLKEATTVPKSTIVNDGKLSPKP